MNSRRIAMAIAALGLIAAGCAPHLVQVPELGVAAREARYRQLLAAREALGQSVDAQVVLWAKGNRAARLPSAEGRLLLAAPDAFRLRVGSIIGTALDFSVHGDSLTAYVPPRRQAVSIDAERDTLGLMRPGGLGFRGLSAMWRVPDEAWSTAVWEDSLVRVRWLEDEDTLSVAVGSSGLPAWASLTRVDQGGVRVAYRGWDRSGGAPWPNLLEVSDLKGPFSVTCKLSVLRFQSRVDPTRLRVPIPASTERLTLADLRRVLERLGAM